jgi:hypothetical protein
MEDASGELSDRLMHGSRVGRAATVQGAA